MFTVPALGAAALRMMRRIRVLACARARLALRRALLPSRKEGRVELGEEEVVVGGIRVKRRVEVADAPATLETSGPTM